MPNLNEFAEGKKLEIITATLRAYFNKQQELLREVTSIKGSLFSALIAAVATLPFAIRQDYIDKAKDIKTPQDLWPCALSFLLTIVVYILVWLIVYLIYPVISNYYQNFKHIKLGGGHVDTCEKFNHVVINRVLILQGMKKKCDSIVESSPSAYKLYFLEIFDDWVYYVNFITRKIVKGNANSLLRFVGNNDGVELANKKINALSLSAVVEILNDISKYIDNKIPTIAPKERSTIQSDYDQTKRDLVIINEFIKKLID
jgi:hypothetical protein